MTGHVSSQIPRQAILDELEAVAHDLLNEGINAVSVSYGWDSNLDIDQMWQPRDVDTSSLLATLLEAEAKGLFTIGSADIFIDTKDLTIQLCHEGDVHIKGESPVAKAALRRWGKSGIFPPRTSSEANI
jgi:hypothetical protein